MRYLFLFLTIVFTSHLNVIGQEFEYDLGSNQKAPEYFTEYTQHLGKHEGFYYNVYMNGYGKVFLEKINSEFNLVTNTLMSKELASAGGSTSKLFHVVLIGDEIKMFYEKTEKDQQQIICNTYSLDGVKQASKLINSMPYSRMGERDFPDFQAKKSKDDKTLAIAVTLGYRTKKMYIFN